MEGDEKILGVEKIVEGDSAPYFYDYKKGSIRCR